MYADQQAKWAPQAGIVGNAEAAGRQAEVPMQMGKLTKALAYAEESVAELLNRLEPMVRPVMPEPTNPATAIAPAPPMTSFGNDLNEYVGRAHRLAERVQDILRRLEV